MLGFGGVGNDAEAERYTRYLRYQLPEVLMSRPRGTVGLCYIVKINLIIMVVTKGVDAMEVECKMFRQGPLPSLCRSDLGRRLEQEEWLIGCRPPSTARQVLKV
jgi:hypothetical protein